MRIGRPLERVREITRIASATERELTKIFILTGGNQIWGVVKNAING